MKHEMAELMRESKVESRFGWFETLIDLNIPVEKIEGAKDFGAVGRVTEFKTY